MSETDEQPQVGEPTADTQNASEEKREFALGEFKINSPSSAETIRKADAVETVEDSKNTADAFSIVNQTETEGKKSDLPKIENLIFRELHEPKMPVLKREDRARLQMQSPTRIHFYWTLKTNPFQTLQRIFGKRAENYTLVVRLLNQTTMREDLSPIEAEGSWWFDVDAGATYQAEIGFYAPTRPFVRLLTSNTIETPRRNPSQRPASESDWAVSADNFAQVLDNAGFAQDAFEVALAGDDAELAETATQTAFEHFFGGTEMDFAADNSSEMRFALLALASGYSLENLREQISPTLFAKLRENAENLNAERALAALQENFDVFADEADIESIEEEAFAPAVFGGSLINFPRRSKRFFKRNALPRFSSVSSSRVAGRSR